MLNCFVKNNFILKKKPSESTMIINEVVFNAGNTEVPSFNGPTIFAFTNHKNTTENPFTLSPSLSYLASPPPPLALLLHRRPFHLLSLI